MTPLDFITYDGGSDPNEAILNIAEALKKPILIHSEQSDWMVLSYYYADGRFHLDIAKLETEE